MTTEHRQPQHFTCWSSQPWPSEAGPSPAPGATACLQLPISNPLLPAKLLAGYLTLTHAAQAPCLPVGLRFISQTVFYAPRASQGSGLTIMCKLLPVSENRNSHPARNPTITQLTKLVTKQPQHLQAGLAESPCPPGERALALWSAALHHPAPPGWLSPALWGKQGWEGLCGGANWTLLQPLRSGPHHLVSRNQFDVCSCLSEGRNTVPVNLHRMAT